VLINTAGRGESEGEEDKRTRREINAVPKEESGKWARSEGWLPYKERERKKKGEKKKKKS